MKRKKRLFVALLASVIGASMLLVGCKYLLAKTPESAAVPTVQPRPTPTATLGVPTIPPVLTPVPSPTPTPTTVAEYE